MTKRLCAALLCLLMTAGLCGCGERGDEKPSEEEFTEPITKIDLTAPENQKYREWLEAYFKNPIPDWKWEFIEPSSTSPKPDRPDMKPSIQDDWIHKGVEESYAQEGPSQEDWKTWDWNDAWELELYCSRKSELGWDVLRARNKATGETKFIGETFNDAGIGFWSSFEAIYINEAYVVYRCGHFDGWSYGFYALGQDKGLYIGRGRESGFLDEERTKWWYREYDYEQSDDDSYPPGYLVSYIDLRKMAAGNADAEREVNIGNEYYCANGWMAERDGRSVACFGVSPWHPDLNALRDPLCIALYDPLDDQIQDYLEVPPLGWTGMVQILPNRFYYFNDGQARAYIKKGDKINWDRAEEQGLSAIDFYVINL